MPSSNICWGIELGAGAVKALKLEREGDGVKVLDFAVIPHKRVLSTPDLDQTDATRVALGALVGQYNLGNATVAISVPGHSAFARFAKLPPVEPKKIPDIVKFEAVQQIPFPINDVEWDYQTFANPDSPEVEVGIFAMTRDRVMERLTMWEEVGVTPSIVTLSPVAVYNAVAYDLAFSEKTPGTVILDVGTTSTDLIVAEAGRVWIRTFPIGGHQFTEALVNAFKLSYLKAEKLKREAEQSKHARHVFQAMRPVFADLAQDVQRSIGYYQSLHRDANLTRLIGLGSTFNLPGLRKYLSQQLQMEVVRLESFNRLKIDGPREADLQAATLGMATAYGLALHGLGLETIDANLMPVRVVREAMWRSKTKWFAAAAGLALVAGGEGFVRPLMERTEVAGQTKPANIDAAKNTLRQLKNQWNDLSAAYKPDYRAANALLLTENREIVPAIMDDVAQMLAVAQAEAREDADKGGPAQGLVFRKFDIKYGREGAAAADVDPSRRVRRGPRRRQTATPEPEETSTESFELSTFDPLSIPGVGRVRMELEVVTARDDADSFLRATLLEWLYDHVGREGMPYDIQEPTIFWTEIGKEKIAEEKPDGTGGTIAVAPPRGPGGGERRQGRRAGRRPVRGDEARPGTPRAAHTRRGDVRGGRRFGQEGPRRPRPDRPARPRPARRPAGLDDHPLPRYVGSAAQVQRHRR